MLEAKVDYSLKLKRSNTVHSLVSLWYASCGADQRGGRIRYEPNAISVKKIRAHSCSPIRNIPKLEQQAYTQHPQTRAATLFTSRPYPHQYHPSQHRRNCRQLKIDGNEK
jgi:hypothetical protein